VMIAVTSSLTSERIYFLNPHYIEFVIVKVYFQSSSIFKPCSYISPESDLIIYDHNLSAIKNVL